MKRLLFIDRDGTIIEEPADEQIDSFEKLKFTEGVIRNLVFIRQRGGGRKRDFFAGPDAPEPFRRR